VSIAVTRLPSGLTIVTDTMPHLQSAALGVWAGVGGRHESADEHGISHLLEHMAFKGTLRRSAQDIVEEIEAVGGDLNAATSAETTAYYARVLKDDVALSLDVLADILVNPTFDPEELQREQNVVIQEIGAAQDTPDDLVFEHLHEIAYPDQPMGRSLLGTAHTVRAFTPARLRDYLRRHYAAPNMVVAAAGAVDHEAIVADAAEKFANLAQVKAPPASPARFAGGVRVAERDLEQAHLTLGLAGVKQGDPGLASMQAFSAIVGGGMSSRLFQDVREKRGLCYSIYTFHAPYSDTGFFGLYSGADPRDAPELMKVVVDGLWQASQTISESEVRRAKAQMKAGLLMGLESCNTRAEQLARHIFAYGHPLSLAEIVARIDRVSVESVRAAGAAMLGQGAAAFAALGVGRGLHQAASIVTDGMRPAA